MHEGSYQEMRFASTFLYFVLIDYMYFLHVSFMKFASGNDEIKSMDRQDKREHSPVAAIFGAHVVSINKCTKCSYEIHKDTTSLLVNLAFPEVINGMYSYSVYVSNVLFLKYNYVIVSL